ncbi:MULTISPECIES: 50S ribosomal protein L24e [Saliphagus]|uniref:Large ribosomal subunit protein eL24 n=1 Tax=Saliphagus infecundisoli TaxID=1849069 RepID=A0ABD5QFN7_9EURY|nr:MULTISPECIES: 50S ribosomal protein L24e [Saliphagus]
MVEHRTCDYTGEEIEPGTGIMYVQTDGSILHFVDSKAEKNYKLGREPRDLEWTEEGRRGKGPADAATDPDRAEESEFDDDGETATSDRVEAETEPQDEVHEDDESEEGDGGEDADGIDAQEDGDQ